MSVGGRREGPPLPSAPGTGSTLDSYSASFPVPQVSPSSLCDLEVRILDQEVRGLGSAPALPHSGRGRDRSLPFLASPAVKRDTEAPCASAFKAKGDSGRAGNPGYAV